MKYKWLRRRERYFWLLGGQNHFWNLFHNNRRNHFFSCMYSTKSSITTGHAPSSSKFDISGLMLVKKSSNKFHVSLVTTRVIFSSANLSQAGTSSYFPDWDKYNVACRKWTGLTNTRKGSQTVKRKVILTNSSSHIARAVSAPILFWPLSFAYIKLYS